MLRHFLIVASLLTINGILFPVLSLISGKDSAFLEDASIITWDTSASNLRLLASLQSALLPSTNHGLVTSPLASPQTLTVTNTTSPSQIPRPIPDWYSLHHLTLCSGTFIWSTDTSTSPSSLTKAKNPATTYCTTRWLDQRANLSQILISAAVKSISNHHLFPTTLYNESLLDTISLSVPSLVSLDYYYDVSPVLPAVATLITGFAFATFSLPLVLLAMYISIAKKPLFRLLPHAAIAFAALSAIFLTASAGLLTGMGNLFSGITPGSTNVSASTSPAFLGFEWAGAVGMWCVVFFVWLGGVWGQTVIVVRKRRVGEKTAAYED
ncbi:MAG: hypothetical protein LQ340_004764 [Diploschistes diacapsis]|nr:MAG: hypothetical protein LQ340_004764 [Diploschistes diacapsis]